MQTGVILLNFGEPSQPVAETVIPFLERIFLRNAPLEVDDPERAHARSRELALRRAPGLIEDYERIGGSPLHAQARAQARALAEELFARGLGPVRTYVAMQFTNPTIPEVVARARADGVDRVVGLPVYPLCGWSTNVAALVEMREAVEALDWDVEVHELNGWHSHPDYLDLRAGAVRRYVEAQGLDLRDPETVLYFSAHGTPVKYLREGSRYDLYVHDFCDELARRLDVPRFALGFQNHANRGVEWTRPDNSERLRTLEARRIVVDAVSFMHEQSETLAELDIDLREEAESLGLEFHRVPIPHDDPRFAGVLADLVTPALGKRAMADAGLHPCLCRRAPGAVCLNATRSFPRRSASAPV